MQKELEFNFDQKEFKLVDNSSHGQVNEETKFLFCQNEQFITALYSGGGVITGHILASIDGKKLDMRYHCITDQNEFKVGKAIARMSRNEANKIVLHLDWEWLNDPNMKGQSTYIEI